MKDFRLPFLPCGAQYYRAPTPPPSEWEKDLRSMAANGFNTVKYWVCWRSNEPRENEYDFSDIDRLMDLAHENGLSVILNVIFDTAPAWFFEKYPESVMIANDGRPVFPTATACRQMGGAPGPCLHHEEGIRARLRFLRACVGRYRSHPALLFWDLWNEPELTCAIRREPRLENLTCCCEASVAAFRAWLREKYKTIGELNRVWGRNYEHFGQAELPRLAQTFQDMIDWRLFMTETVSRECALRVRTAKELDGAHPVMVHAVTLPFFPLATCGSDEYALAEPCDLFGNSVGSEPVSAAITLSAAPDKPVINAEIHAIAGSTYARPRRCSLRDMKRHFFLPLSLGIQGFLFWQYRPERLGLEAPAWGLTDLRGEPTPWLADAARISRALQRHADVILRAKRPQTRAAVWNSQRGQLFDFCADPQAALYSRSVKGAFEMLRAAGYLADVIGDRQIDAEFLKRYQVIYAPFPYYMEEQDARLLRGWVEAGGVLIAEACFGGYSGSDGLHTLAQPGFGFDEVFGARELRMETTAALADAYGEQWAGAGGEALARLDFGGETLAGVRFCETMELLGGEALAFLPDGGVAAAGRAFGRGRAVWLGTLAACAYEGGCRENAKTLRRLIEKTSTLRPALRADEEGALCSLLEAEAGCLIVAENGSDSPAVTLRSCASALPGSRFVNILTGETAVAQAGESGGWVRLPVAPGEIEVFRV